MCSILMGLALVAPAVLMVLSWWRIGARRERGRRGADTEE